jgi:hypothetical protein
LTWGAWRLGELISELQAIKDAHGDMPVFMIDHDNSPKSIWSICGPVSKKETVIKIR